MKGSLGGAVAVLIVSSTGCRRTTSSVTTRTTDAAAAQEAAAPVVEAPAFAVGRTLATWSLEKDHSVVIVGVDVAHTRAIAEVSVGGADPHPTEILTIDWTAHTTTRVALRNLGPGLGMSHDPKVDFGGPETVSELAAYGTALRGARAFDRYVSVAPDAIFVQWGDAIVRSELDGKRAQRFAADASSAAISPHGDVIAYVTTSGLRIASVASVAGERRIDVSNASRPSFSPDGHTLYVATRPDKTKPPCLVAANVSTGAVRKLACATIPQWMNVIMAPSGQRAALFATGGPSGIGAPEMTIVSLPAGLVQSRARLEWSMETYTALTDDGDVVGTTWTNQWGSPGRGIAVRAHDPAHPMGAAARDDFTVESIALENGHTVLALAMKRAEGASSVELAEVPLGP